MKKLIRVERKVRTYCWKATEASHTLRYGGASLQEGLEQEATS